MVDPAKVDAVILVGGQGTRLRPLTLSAPKPMLPTAGLPFLTHMLSRIAAAGIEHVVLGTSYKAEVFEAEFGDGSKLGLHIEYVVEEQALGTGGGIANVAPKLRHDTVLVFNGDVLSGGYLGALLACLMVGIGYHYLMEAAWVTLPLLREFRAPLALPQFFSLLAVLGVAIGALGSFISIRRFLKI